jgi:uncharacterized membrane protein
MFLKTLISFLKDEDYRDLLYTSALIILLGTFVYHFLEGWGYLDSLYFSVVTLTTIGYGDLAPKTDMGKIFTIFYIIIGLAMILNFINTVQHHYNQTKEKQRKK